jgi:hypothetical protein
VRISQKPCNISQARLRAARERLSSNCILLKSVSDPARIVQRKENAPEFDYSSFYAKTGARDPPLFGGSPAFLMTRLRTAAHEETELLTVLYFPFRVRTPYTSFDVLVDEYLSGIELATHHLFRRIYSLLGRGADLWPARYEAKLR